MEEPFGENVEGDVGDALGVIPNSNDVPGNNPVIFTMTSPSSLFMANLTSITLGDSNSTYYDNYTNLGGEGGGEFDGDDNSELPKELTEMSESSKHCVIAYCILFVIATSGNLTVLLSVFKQYKKNKSRISLLILHLSIADLIVCCTLIPTEVFWRLTIQWRGGNLLCKVMQFLRAFGLYLSSMVLICVSFDRFFAIIFPMKMLKRQGHQRIKLMLWIAWIASIAFSSPQAILFKVVAHPSFPSFQQCVSSSEFLENTEDVRLYSIFSVTIMYFAPLAVIIFTYTAILIKIIRKSHQPNSEDQQNTQQRNRPSIRLRMSIRISGAHRNTESQHLNHNNTGTNQIMASGGNLQNQEQQTEHTHHSKLLAFAGSGHGCKKGPNHSTNSQDVGECSSEDGSFSGSTCSTMNVASHSTSYINPLTVDKTVTERYHQPQSFESCPTDGNSGRPSSHRTHLVLRRSENAASNMSRAKNKTLFMTIVIVCTFVVTWTPYVIIVLWYMFDWEGAQEVDPRLQDALFVMAVGNSCVNPLIYGTFSKNCCGLSKIFCRLRRNGSQ